MSILVSTLEWKENSDDFFQRAVMYSLAAHFVLLLGVTLKDLFFKGEPLMYEGAVRVDLVALPDKLLRVQTHSEDKTSPQVVPPKIESKTRDAINLDKSKRKETAAMNKLHEMDALEKIKHDIEAKERMDKAAKVFKGNQLASGTELRGLSKLEHDDYVAQIKRRVYDHWDLPEWLAQKNLKAQVLAKFDESGNLIFAHIVKSSGNPSYDEIIVETVQKSSPVPAPPEPLVKILSSEGVLIGFPE